MTDRNTGMAERRGIMVTTFADRTLHRTARAAGARSYALG
jgi:hypothetical protein